MNVRLAFFLGLAIAIIHSFKAEETEVKLEFIAFNLEDQCISKNDVIFQYYNGTSNNLTELRTVIHDSSKWIKREMDEWHNGPEKPGNPKEYNEREKRMFDMLFRPGAAVLPESNLIEYTDFIIKATEGLSASKQNPVNQELLKTRNATAAATIWQRWFKILDDYANGYPTHLQCLEDEAEHNGAENAEEYWLKNIETTWTNYTHVQTLWEQLLPLYQKLRQFIAKNMIARFSSNEFSNPKLLPVHLLGTLDSTDWVTTAEGLNALQTSDTYRILLGKLRQVDDKKMYQFADIITSDLQKLPKTFFDASQFERKSENCTNLLADNCRNDFTPRVLTCYDPEKDKNPVLLKWLRAHAQVARIKHMRLADANNSYLLREGPRQSAIYEAVDMAASLLSLNPTYLQEIGLLENISQDANMTSLLISALYVIPAMPYYLTADLWRLQTLKKLQTEQFPITEESSVTNSDTSKTSDINFDDDLSTAEPTTSATQFISNNYDKANVTADWWELRAKLQGVAPPDIHDLHADYLQDPTILTNSPFLSKFIGRILVFQIIDKFQVGRKAHNINKLLEALKQGKSVPWEDIAHKTFNITQLSMKPMLEFFRPLEIWLDAGGAFYSLRNDTPIFANFNTFLTSPEDSRTNPKSDEKKIVSADASEGSNAFLLVLLGLAVVGCVAGAITFLRKRNHKKKLAKKRRNIDHI